MLVSDLRVFEFVFDPELVPILYVEKPSRNPEKRKLLRMLNHIQNCQKNRRILPNEMIAIPLRKFGSTEVVALQRKSRLKVYPLLAIWPSLGKNREGFGTVSYTHLTLPTKA